MISEEQRPNRERSLANLVPFRPGQSGNPGGRPKGRSLTSILREVLAGRELCGEPVPGDRTVAEALVEALLMHAIRGDATLLREVLGRVDGKAPETPPDDLDALSDDELIALATGRAGGTGPTRPDDPPAPRA